MLRRLLRAESWRLRGIPPPVEITSRPFRRDLRLDKMEHETVAQDLLDKAMWLS